MLYVYDIITLHENYHTLFYDYTIKALQATTP